MDQNTNKNQENKLWFKAKRYGWGWYPACKEGWFTMIIAIILLVGLASTSDLDHATNKEALLHFFLPEIIIIGTLIWICFKKGEKPRWRWGEKED